MYHYVVMKFIIVFFFVLASSCTTSMLTDNSNVILKSRITYYSVGEDKWGDLVACPKTPRAKEGITVAAHPDFPFGTKIKIPSLSGIIGDGIFIVQDRGSAVTKKKASKGECHVFDVFVKTKNIMYKHANKNNMYMDVHVLDE